jgi:hypothetical protein
MRSLPEMANDREQVIEIFAFGSDAHNYVKIVETIG